MEVNMRNTLTLKNAFISGLLLFAGVSVSMAQENGAALGTGLTASSATYRLNIPNSVGGGSDVTVESTGGTGIGIRPTPATYSGNLVYNVDIPVGTPLDGSVNVVINGSPLWHVTVADILGADNSNPGGVMLRPIKLDGDSPSAGSTGSGTTAPSITAVTSGPAATSGSGGYTPKADVYPNPATDDVNIVTEGEVLWGVTEIIDITGKKILEIPTGRTSPATGTNRVNINVSSLKTGVYFIRVRVGNEIQTKRVQVNR